MMAGGGLPQGERAGGAVPAAAIEERRREAFVDERAERASRFAASDMRCMSAQRGGCSSGSLTAEARSTAASNRCIHSSPDRNVGAMMAGGGLPTGLREQRSVLLIQSTA